MIIVPVKGDKIVTKDGVSFTVMSYTNYRDKGPAVYVEHTPEVPSDAVYFFDIARINNVHVEYMSGPKVFRSGGKVKRRVHLPQATDRITAKIGGETKEFTVTGYKLHKRGDLAKGLLMVSTDDETKEKVFIRLSSIIDIERDIGNDLFSRDRFLSYYKDYTGSR